MARIYFLGIAAIFAVACTDQSMDEGPSEPGVSLGNVYIAPEPSSAEMITRVEGGTDSLFFRASEGDVDCDSIAVITADGEAHPVQEGLIEEGDEARVAVPEDARDFTRIRFQCSTDDPLRAKLDIAYPSAE